MMHKLSEIIRRKPVLFLIISLGYLVGVGFAKWQIHPPAAAIWFLVGGAIGVYFLDAAEVFFALTPSPFRSIVFAGAFAIMSLFVLSSSGSFLAAGLVFSLYLTLILWQVGEWQYRGSLNNWFTMIQGQVSVGVQRWIFIAFIFIFFIDTYAFLTWM